MPERGELDRLREAFHRQHEAVYAFADRAHWLGDPAFVDVPASALMDAAYVQGRMASFDRERTTPSVEVGHGTPPGLPAEGTETTHYSIVDAEGNAVAVENAVLRDGRYARIGGEYAHQIERIGAAHDGKLTAFLELAHCAQPSDRFRQSELLAAEAADETAAADFTARLEPAIDHHQLAPRRQPRFAREHRTKDDAVTLQQRACNRFGAFFACDAVVSGKQRPSPCGIHAIGRPPGAGPAAREALALLRRREQRAQAAETVGGHHADACKLAECALDVRAQQSRRGDDLMSQPAGRPDEPALRLCFQTLPIILNTP